MKHSILSIGRCAALFAALHLASSALASDQTWKGTSDNQWTTSGDWSGNALPGTGDAVIYNNLSTGNLSNWLGQDFAIKGIVFSNVPAPVSISSANTLTLTNGINMSNALQTLTINAPLTVGTGTTTNQIWAVAPNQSLLVQGPVSGPATLYKDAQGTLYLNGTNTFTGSFTNNGGPVWINNSAALGAGTKTIQIANNLVGAGLHLNGTNGNISLPANQTFIVSQNLGAVINEAGDNTINGNMYVFSGGGLAYVLANGGTLTLNGTIGLSTSARPFMIGGAGDGTINGAVTAGLPLTKADGGTWTLNAHNSYTGATTIQGGTLALGANATIANTPSITILSNAVFDVSDVYNPSYAANAFYLSTAVAQTLGGNGSINGSVSAANSATLAPGAINTAGTLNFSKNLALGYMTAQFKLNTATTAGNGVNDLINVGGDIDPWGSTVFITATSPLTSPGTYTLFNYDGAEINPFAFASTSTDTRYTFTLDDSVTNHVSVQVSGNNENLTWSGGNGATWDLISSPNWDSDTQLFYSADNVTFDDTSANNLVSISTTVRPGAVTIGNNSATYAFTGNGKITGPTTVTKTGTGTAVIYNANNDFTGPVVVNGGRLVVTNFATVGNSSPLGAGGNITLDGGTFVFGGARPAAGTVNRTWTLGANGGTLLTTNATFFIANQISGPGSLTKTGSLQVILGDIVTGVLSSGASNSYSGNTFITQGELQIRNNHALGTGKVVVSSGADLAFGGSVNYGTLTNNIDLNGGDGNNGAGTLQVNDGNTSATYGGTINLLANSSVGTINNGNAVTFNITGPLVGPGLLKKLGTNTVSLTNPGNTYAGGTLIGSGTLQLGTGGTAGTLGTGPVTNNAALVFNHTDSTTNSAGITGTGSLTHKGAGSLALNGPNTCTGTTTVSAGTLLVNGSLGTNTVSVASSATLGGYGVIGGPVSINSGGTLALGSAIGTLTVNSNLTLAGTNVMKISKSGSTLTHDLIQGVSALNFGGTLKVVASGDPLTGGDTFKLFNAAAYNGVFAATNLPALGGPLAWDTSGLTNGTIKVVSTVSPPTKFTSMIVLPNHTFQLTFSNAPGLSYRLWASTNVALAPVTSTWTQLSSGTFSGLPVTFTDTQATNLSRRFYEVTTP
jgi:autotransporter-associated beta strand protein